MNDKPISIPAVLESYKSTLTKGLKLTFCSNENVAPELLSWIIQFQNKLGYLFFGVKQIEAVDLQDLPKIDTSKYAEGKTPSTRLRNVLYLLYQKKQHETGNMDDAKIKAGFNEYYQIIMEKLIEQYKAKLNED
jgi:hypothetical protein